MTNPQYDSKDFAAALKESLSPDLSSWEFFVESHGLSIYRLYKQVSFTYCISLILKLKNM